jgi:hypothetical protein
MIFGMIKHGAYYAFGKTAPVYRNQAGGIRINNLTLKGEVCCSPVVVRLMV